jgi:hypothetical protein
MRMTSPPSSRRCFLAEGCLSFLSQTPKGTTTIGLTGTPRLICGVAACMRLWRWGSLYVRSANGSALLK